MILPALKIMACPIHKVQAVAVELDGKIGLRVTSGKCCGQWRDVKVWRLTESQWLELARLAEDCAALIEEAGGDFDDLEAHPTPDGRPRDR